LGVKMDLDVISEKLIFKDKFDFDGIKKKSLIFFIDDKLKDRLDSKALMDFPVKYIKGGESLKTLEQYKKNAEFLFKSKAHKKTLIVAVGGGSLLDSVGFLASTFLRGLDLVLVPTTWLSCVDASVGGKTALNWLDKKNQVGTVYPPKAIYFFKDLIHKESFKEAQGEILKTLFLNHRSAWAEEHFSKGKVKFENLKNFVRYKSKIVKLDPLEKHNIRTVLNLGHTLGHVVELKRGLNHGESVLYGLKFSLEWSRFTKKINEKNFQKLNSLLPRKSLKDLKLSKSEVEKFLLFDKKREGESLNFVFLNNKGPEVIKIPIDNIVKEYERQSYD